VGDDVAMSPPTSCRSRARTCAQGAGSSRRRAAGLGRGDWELGFEAWGSECRFGV